MRARAWNAPPLAVTSGEAWARQTHETGVTGAYPSRSRLARGRRGYRASGGKVKPKRENPLRHGLQGSIHARFRGMGAKMPLPRCLARQDLHHAPRDGGSRVDPLHRPGCQLLQALHQQRIMRAGQHDVIRASPILFHETGRDLGRNRLIRHGFPTQCTLGETGQSLRADKRHRYAIREIADEFGSVIAAHGARRGEHRDKPAFGGRRRRLDRGNRANDRHREPGPQRRQNQRRGRVTGDDHAIRRKIREGRADHIEHAGNQRGWLQGTIGEAGIIREIEVIRTGQRRPDRAENREATKPGIEHENAGFRARFCCDFAHAPRPFDRN